MQIDTKSPSKSGRKITKTLNLTILKNKVFVTGILFHYHFLIPLGVYSLYKSFG